MSDSKQEKKTTKTIVSIPVQATITVPVVVDFDIGDTKPATYKKSGGFDFVDLEKMDNGEEIGKQIIDACTASPVVMDAVVILRSAIDLHLKKYKDCKGAFCWYAGVMEEEEILPEE